MIALICLYEFYNLIILESPAKHYGLYPGSPIAILAIAQSQDQVKETLFKAIKGYAEGSAYFQGLIRNKTIELGAEEIRCYKKKISIFAKHTNSKSLVGYNVKCLILDEAARFEYDEFGKSKADGIWDNIGNSVTSRFGIYGKKIAISSAWEPGDYIEKLYDIAEQSITTLGFRLKTWQVNLNPNSSELMIKNSDMYIKDPIFAAVEFEGVRALKQGSFFVPANVKAAFTGYSAVDAIQVPLNVTNKDGDTRYYTGIEINRLEKCNTQSFAHVDYGVKKDGAAFAVCSPVEIEPKKWGISIDVLILWKPYDDRDKKSSKGIKRIVSFPNSEDIFYQVAKARRVVKFSFDSYQSQSVIQRLHMEGINTCEMSTATTEQSKYYTVTRTLMNHGLLILPKDSHWSTSAELELSNIIELPNGKITHSIYAKDLSDAITNSVYNCYTYMIKNGIITQNSAYSSTISKISNAPINGNNSKLHSDARVKLRSNSNREKLLRFKKN